MQAKLFLIFTLCIVRGESSNFLGIILVAASLCVSFCLVRKHSAKPPLPKRLTFSYIFVAFSPLIFTKFSVISLLASGIMFSKLGSIFAFIESVGSIYFYSLWASIIFLYYKENKKSAETYSSRWIQLFTIFSYHKDIMKNSKLIRLLGLFTSKVKNGWYLIG